MAGSGGDAKICSLGMYNLMIDHDNVIDLVHLMGVFKILIITSMSIGVQKETF